MSKHHAPKHKNRRKQPMPAADAREMRVINKHMGDGTANDVCVLYRTSKEFKDGMDDECRQTYEESKNPLWAWHAYITAREVKTKVPEWVMQYLDGVANGLLSHENKLADCALHLGFDLKGGGKNPFKQILDGVFRSMAVREVRRQLAENPGMTVDAACETVNNGLLRVCQQQVDIDTLKRWYSKLSD